MKSWIYLFRIAAIVAMLRWLDVLMPSPHSLHGQAMGATVFAAFILILAGLWRLAVIIVRRQGQGDVT